jgi:hypothetical protein
MPLMYSKTELQYTLDLLEEAIDKNSPCIKHGKDYLVICPECEAVSCSYCTIARCYCDNDD